MTTKTIKKHYRWLLDQAVQMTGLHSGGPYEDTFNNSLKAAEKAYKHIHQCECKKPGKDVNREYV